MKKKVAFSFILRPTPNNRWMEMVLKTLEGVGGDPWKAISLLITLLSNGADVDKCNFVDIRQEGEEVIVEIYSFVG